MTIGVDLGDRRSHACVLDHAGAVVERFAFDSTTSATRAAFAARRGRGSCSRRARHSPWSSRLLAELGLEVIVANPNQLALIARSHRKTDRNDAELLARLGRADLALLRPVEHRSAAQQAHLELLKARDAVLRSRTLLVNHVRGALKAFGVRAPACDADAFATKAAEHVPEALRAAIAPMLAAIARPDEVDPRLRPGGRPARATTYPRTVGTAPGPRRGPADVAGLRARAGVGDALQESRQVGAYLGLCPKVTQSGEQDPQNHISKAGNGFMRRLLVQSAQYITGPFGEDSTLRRVGLRLMASGGRPRQEASRRRRRTSPGRDAPLACGRRARCTSACATRRRPSSPSPLDRP